MFYKLDEKNQIVSCDDPQEFAEWFAKEDRVIALDHIEDNIISTVFVGIDHNWEDTGTPVLFETMVFKPHNDTELIARYHTYNEALGGHKRTVARHTLKVV